MNRNISGKYISPGRIWKSFPNNNSNNDKKHPKNFKNNK